MTNEQEDLQVVQRLFAAFGRADLPAALGTLAENVDFQSPVTRNAPAQITWAKPRHSRQEVAAFFKELAEKMQIQRMEALEYTAQPGRVVVEGRNHGIVTATGRAYEHDWVMVFTLQDGKIIRHRHYYDTADIVAAFRSN